MIFKSQVGCRPWNLFLIVVTLFALVLDRLQRSDEAVYVYQKNVSSQSLIRRAGATNSSPRTESTTAISAADIATSLRWGTITPAEANNTTRIDHASRVPSGSREKMIPESSSETAIPQWSNLPRSQFTDQVLAVIDDLNPDAIMQCSNIVRFTVSSPNSVPNITCQQEENGDHIWCLIMLKIFENTTIPYNVSLGFVMTDFCPEKEWVKESCISVAVPEGELCTPMMHDLNDMIVQGTTRLQMQSLHRRRHVNATAPWEQRNPVPVFRGKAWLPERSQLNLCRDEKNLSRAMILREFPRRFIAVDVSMNHPELLDARFDSFDWVFDACMPNNATNGLDKFLPVNPIDEEKYFSEYQVALVLSDADALVRINRHFMSRTAVILQEFKYRDWYIPMLKPFVHYIPVAKDLHDLEEKLIWVKNHPDEVKSIGESGRAFYDRWLTFAKQVEHMHELVYRMSEYTAYLARNKLVEVKSSTYFSSYEKMIESVPSIVVNSCNMSGIPSWSNLPRSRFTDHVLDVVLNLNIGEIHKCPLVYNFTTEFSFGPPNITYLIDERKVGVIWDIHLHQIFESRVIPYNVSFGLNLNDRMDLNPTSGSACLGNSAPDGKFCVPNIEDLGQMITRQQLRGTNDYRYPITNDKPWDQRKVTPIFRGAAWIPERSMHALCRDPNATYDAFLQEFPGRFKAVDFSVDHPDMLDARFTSFVHTMQPCLSRNATNGLHKLMAFDPIDTNEYFESYQVALVLSGIGAAFRLSRHFQAGTTVLLQDFKYKEWYTPMLEPFVHYIPIAEDMGDLEEKLIWVKNHPDIVKGIAENGRSFYEKYLTFEGHEEHIFELVHRLSEYSHFISKDTPG